MFVSKISRRFKVLHLKRTYITESGVPKIDISKFISKSPDYLEECKRAAHALETSGCFAFQDPRVNYSHNDELLNLMERYFDERAQRYYKGEKNLEDFHPELHYQTGLTPEGAGKARDLNIEQMKTYTGENAARTPIPFPNNMNWRYIWRIAERPKNVQSIITEPPQNFPKDYPEFERICKTWGRLVLNAGLTISEMLALGLGLEQNSFSRLMEGGTHILSPTGSDLKKLSVGDVLSAFHYDLNFCTIHGKSRFPGLDVWLRNGTKIPVAIPEGWLLVQSGKQMEILTGGHILAGFHEVIYNEKTKAAKEKAEREGKYTWRVSSTVFLQTSEDTILQPLSKYSTEESRKKYPPILTSKQVEEEVTDIYRVTK